MQSVLRLRGHVPQAALPLRLLGARTFAVSPGDAFTTQLQAKTERELEEMLERSNRPVSVASAETARQEAEAERIEDRKGENGGPRGPEPTRYGDWEKAGRCSDF